MQAEIEAIPAYKNYIASYKDSMTLQISKKSSGGSTDGSSGGNGGNGDNGSSIITPPLTPEQPNPPTTAEINVNSKADSNGNAMVI